MSLNETQASRSFRNFEEAADHILALLSMQLDINTLFIAKNDGRRNEIVRAVNAKETLVEEGHSSPLNQTFCSLSINHGKDALIIKDISADPLSNELEIASRFGHGSFVGIPVYYENGEVYGTICGLDTESFEFTEENQRLFEMMSSLLTYVLELEKANEQIQFLSSPLVPVTKGVAILPIIGDITAKRAQFILNDVLVKCSDQNLDYLVIDVSGVSQINSVVGEYLLKLVSMLKLVGIAPVLTGIQPYMALKVPHFAESLKGILIEANLETALKQLGFVLMKECEEKTDRRG